jgi:peptide/nickel transport system ATP-binding protein
MEIAPTAALFAAPQHPYTIALLSAIPIPDPDARRTRVVMTGEIPSATNPPSGCVFRTRCPIAITRCADEVPDLRDLGDGHHAACLRA